MGGVDELAKPQGFQVVDARGYQHEVTSDLRVYMGPILPLSKSTINAGENYPDAPFLMVTLKQG